MAGRAEVAMTLNCQNRLIFGNFNVTPELFGFFPLVKIKVSHLSENL